MSDVSVITGGAGGMGLATARIIGRDQSVVICDVSEERVAAGVAELKRSGIAVCEGVVCDITDRASVAELVGASQQHGKVSSVVHTAGVSPSMGEAERIMRINALGTLYINEAFLLNAEEGCTIVNVASMAAYMFPKLVVPTRRFDAALGNEKQFMTAMMRACNVAPRKLRPGLAYSISKNFVLWYTASQASRFGSRGARIVSVSPGSIDTDMGRLEEKAGSGAVLQFAALKRFGTPDEVAELLAFCAGPKASYLTGIDIPCDGGVLASITWRDRLAIARSV